MVKNIVIFSLLIVATSANLSPKLIRCPNVSVPDTFDIRNFVGIWYEAEKTPNIWTLNTKCVTADYELKSDTEISVKNSAIRKLSGLETSVYGTATEVSPGKLDVAFPMTSNRKAPFWVLGTDYDNYAVVYSCQNGLLSLGKPNVWILTRTRNPDAAILDEAYGVLSANNISQRLLRKTDQTGCPNSN